MRRVHRVVAFWLVVVSIGSPAALNAAPLFYLSDQPLGLAQPGMFSLNSPASGAAGQLNIYAMTDVRLAGVSLDLLTSGGGIRFSGLDVVNDGRWMILDGPQVIEDSKITSIGGGAVPGVNGTGIGPGDFVDANFHPTSGYLLATVDYEVIDAAVSASFELRAGNNTIADWQGESPLVHFGVWSQPAVPGYPPHLPRLPELPQPDPSQPPATPVPDPMQNPVELPPKPDIADPQPPSHPEPLVPDPTIVDGPSNGPQVWTPFIWHGHEFTGEVILKTFVPLTPDQLHVIDETGVAVDINHSPFFDNQFYVSRFDGTSVADDQSFLHSAASLVNDGVITVVKSDDTSLVVSNSDADSGQTLSGLERALLTSLPASEYFRASTTFAGFGGLAATGSLDLSASVPEPATVALAALALLAIGGLRFRPTSS
jgi:hypothetical protein